MSIEDPQRVKEEAAQLREEIAEWSTRSRREKISAACLGLAALFTYASNFLKDHMQTQTPANPEAKREIVANGQTLEHALYYSLLLFALIAAVAGIVLFASVIKKHFNRKLFESFVDTHLHMAEALQERLSREDLLKLERLFELVHDDRHLSPIDQNRLVRDWLIHFIDVVSNAHEEDRRLTCFSFQSLGAPKVLTSTQLQLIALQTRICLRRQYDPVTRALHSCAPALFLDRLHRSALSNIRKLFIDGGKYAKGRYLSSRIHVTDDNGNHEIETPGLVRILFWTVQELKSESSQRYLSIWDAFGIPTFWIERDDESCSIIIDALRQLPQGSKIREAIRKAARPAVEALLRDGWSKGQDWPRDLDFITVDDQVVMGYGDTRGTIDWYRECSSEFTAFLAQICTLLEHRIYYASEASWQHSSGDRANLNELRQRSGFVFLHDFFVEENKRLGQEVARVVP